MLWSFQKKGHNIRLTNLQHLPNNTGHWGHLSSCGWSPIPDPFLCPNCVLLSVAHICSFCKNVVFTWNRQIIPSWPPIDVARPQSWSSKPIKVQRTWGSLLAWRKDDGKFKTPETKVLVLLWKVTPRIWMYRAVRIEKLKIWALSF